MGTFAETAIVDYLSRLLIKENKLPFSVYVYIYMYINRYIYIYIYI